MILVIYIGHVSRSAKHQCQDGIGVEGMSYSLLIVRIGYGVVCIGVISQVQQLRLQ